MWFSVQNFFYYRVCVCVFVWNTLQKKKLQPGAHHFGMLRIKCSMQFRRCANEFFINQKNMKILLHNFRVRFLLSSKKKNFRFLLQPKFLLYSTNTIHKLTHLLILFYTFVHYFIYEIPELSRKKQIIELETLEKKKKSWLLTIFNVVSYMRQLTS